MIARPVALLLFGLASPGLAEGLDVPDQIQIPSGGGTADLQIGGAAAGNPVSVEQSTGGRDVCDPSVSASTRRRAGVDCDAPEAGGKAPDAYGQTGTQSDPLLQPRDDDQRRQFESLRLGDDVPATVILQQ
ncbi:MAG: hypothetical protein AAFU49_15390 [Pseudomonadota bacterium]